jgi:hypothetical protein
MENRSTKKMMLMNVKTWYKNALSYKAHALAFYDSNNNGIGDLRGITEILDFIKKLRLSCTWLLSIIPTLSNDGFFDIVGSSCIQNHHTLVLYELILKHRNKSPNKVLVGAVLRLPLTPPIFQET